MRIPATLEVTSPAPPASVEAAQAALHRRIPVELLELFEISDGVVSEDGVTLYRSEAIAERNATFEVGRYANSWIAIGDDSGGRLIMMSPSGQGVLVDAGSVQPEDGLVLSSRLSDWVESGAMIEEEASGVPSVADVYLEVAPREGLRGLLRIKRGLALEIAHRDLKKVLEEGPVRLQRCVPYGQAMVLCRRLNEAERCLGLRHVDDPVRKIAIPGRGDLSR